MILSFDEAKRAIRAKVETGSHAPKQVVVSTDTRTIESGQTYLALRGDRFDGHEYVAQAIAKGAAAVVLDAAPPKTLEVATLLVADTKAAYMALAAAARKKFRGQVIAVTGSTGKTTTKVLLAQLLETKYGKDGVAASPANENNEIGVSKLLLGVDPACEVLVVEMGARHYGDIEALVKIAQPHYGVLTNVGEAHLEIMGTRERLAATKWALFSQGARAVLNVRDEVSRMRAGALIHAPRWFGLGEPEFPQTHPSEGGVFIRDRHTLIVVDGDVRSTYHLNARLPGDYNLENLAAALGGALELGCSPEALADAVQHVDLPRGRYETIEIGNGARLIYDAYNASMSGMVATLDAFAQEPATRRIAVLASMAELGPDAPHMHTLVGEHASKTNLDVLLVGGTFASQIAAGAREAGFPQERIVTFASNNDAIAWLKKNVTSGDAVLLKGSRLYKLEHIAEGLLG